MFLSLFYRLGVQFVRFSLVHSTLKSTCSPHHKTKRFCCGALRFSEREALPGTRETVTLRSSTSRVKMGADIDDKSKVIEKILEEVDCPVCFEIMCDTKIMLCMNGHSVCQDCRNKVRN